MQPHLVNHIYTTTAIQQPLLNHNCSKTILFCGCRAKIGQNMCLFAFLFFVVMWVCECVCV